MANSGPKMASNGVPVGPPAGVPEPPNVPSASRGVPANGLLPPPNRAINASNGEPPVPPPVVPPCDPQLLTALGSAKAINALGKLTVSDCNAVDKLSPLANRAACRAAGSCVPSVVFRLPSKLVSRASGPSTRSFTVGSKQKTKAPNGLSVPIRPARPVNVPLS